MSLSFVKQFIEKMYFKQSVNHEYALQNLDDRVYEFNRNSLSKLVKNMYSIYMSSNSSNCYP